MQQLEFKISPTSKVWPLHILKPVGESYFIETPEMAMGGRKVSDSPCALAAGSL
jgi:hypothetical protein